MYLKLKPKEVVTEVEVGKGVKNDDMGWIGCRSHDIFYGGAFLIAMALLLGANIFSSLGSLIGGL